MRFWRTWKAGEEEMRNRTQALEARQTESLKGWQELGTRGAISPSLVERYEQAHYSILEG